MKGFVDGNFEWNFYSFVKDEAFLFNINERQKQQKATFENLLIKYK